MERALIWIDKLNTWVGRTFAWSIVALVFVVCFEVFSRYLFHAPTKWAFDVSYMLYGLLFMAAGAYTLSRNAHVRGDFLYRNWRPRRQAMMDLILYIIFFFPGILALCWAGALEADRAWMTWERSNSPATMPLAPFKTIIPIVGVLLFLQGIVETIRCIQCIHSGAWPRRLRDVEELEKQILEEAERKKAMGLDPSANGVGR